MPISDFLMRLLSGPRLSDEQTRNKADLELLLSSPFARDTLFPLIGGPPSAIHIRPIPWNAYGQGQTGGFASPIGRFMLLSPEADEETLVHEAGHIADYRNTIPQFDDIADKYWSKQRGVNEGDYSSTNKLEYKASLFESALQLIREASVTAQQHGPYEGYRDLIYMAQDEESRLAGISEATLALLGSPVFANHPLAMGYRSAANFQRGNLGAGGTW